MIGPLQHSLRRLLFVAALLPSFCQAAAAIAGDRPPVLKLPTGASQDGHVKITWDLGGEDTAVELQQAESKRFEGARLVYRGTDRATFISGLENGTYYYRIRRIGGTWSSAATLKVKHHSLQLAFTLFSLGAVVFALTVFVVVKGTLNTPSEKA